MANKRRSSGRETDLKRKEAKRSAANGQRSAGNQGRTSGKGRNSTSDRKRRRKGMSAASKVAIAVCVILLVFVLAAIGVLASKMSKLNTEHIDADKLSISEELELDQTGYLNVALFGLDTREKNEDLSGISRSDTIMIASLNRETKEVKLASVYRDTLLQMTDMKAGEGEHYNYSDVDLQKANAAYAFGEEEEAISMLNRNLDLDIQKYVTVDFSALVDVINALGGIEIDVTEEEVDYINGYGTEVASETGVITDYVYNAGLQVLDGVQATSYCRIRQTLGDDFKRAERQRTVLTKVAEKAQEADIATLNKIVDKVFPKLKTNFTLTEILAYAKDVKKYQLGETLGFPMEKETMSYPGQGDSVVPVTLEGNVIELHKYLFGTEESYTPTSTVRLISDMIADQTGFAESGSEIYTDTGGTTDTGIYTGTEGYDNGNAAGSGYEGDMGAVDSGYGTENGYGSSDGVNSQWNGTDTTGGNDTWNNTGVYDDGSAEYGY